MRAALSVNREVIALYWKIGRMITEQQENEGWGAKVIDRSALDLKNELPEIRGFSARNLKRMKAFYAEYPAMPERIDFLQPSEIREGVKVPQLVAQKPEVDGVSSKKVPQVVALADTDIDTDASIPATELTIDLSSTIGPATHVGSGSLYGVTETLPGDVDGLIAPTGPKMFTNPAADVQQPRGDAIEVAKRVASTGATVTIRLADWFPGRPYQFSNITDWFDKLGQTVTKKQASGVDNYYGYEIWNEPNATWTSSISFNDFWKQSYDKLRELDPDAKIIGPSGDPGVHRRRQHGQRGPIYQLSR